MRTKDMLLIIKTILIPKMIGTKRVNGHFHVHTRQGSNS